MLKEVDKVMRGSGLSAPAFYNVRSGISKGLQSIEKFYKIANTKKESINEVTDKEINMARKLSKDMEKVKKGYQQIAKTGDKTLKSTGFNATYESILKAQQKVLSLIGELTTMKQISDRGASIRIPVYTVEHNWNGYLEDRRPASNADPYKIVSHIVGTLTK